MCTQVIVLSGTFSARDMSPRSGNTPWLCVHTVSLPSLSARATAHDGPIDPCD